MGFAENHLLNRRQALCGVAGLAGLVASGGLADPARAGIATLTIIIPSSPGGGYDQTARSVQSALQTSGIVPAVQVENVPAGGGIVGINTVLGRVGDPGTILQGGLATIVTSLTSKATVDINRLSPLARLTSEYQVIVVPGKSDLKTIGDLVARMKTDPASVSWAGGPAGSHDHVSVGLFATGIGVDASKINYVPYRGASISLAVLGEQVTAAVSGVSEFEEHVAAGTIRILAIMSPERIENADAPTLKESGIDVVFGNWRGLFAAPELPEAAYDDLVSALTDMEKTETWQTILKTKGWGNAFLSGSDFTSFFRTEQERLSAMLKAIGVVN